MDKRDYPAREYIAWGILKWVNIGNVLFSVVLILLKVFGIQPMSFWVWVNIAAFSMSAIVVIGATYKMKFLAAKMSGKGD
jgi:hypothetical protein